MAHSMAACCMGAPMLLRHRYCSLYSDRLETFWLSFLLACPDEPSLRFSPCRERWRRVWLFLSFCPPLQAACSFYTFLASCASRKCCQVLTAPASMCLYMATYSGQLMAILCSQKHHWSSRLAAFECAWRVGYRNPGAGTKNAAPFSKAPRPFPTANCFAHYSKPFHLRCHAPAVRVIGIM